MEKCINAFDFWFKLSAAARRDAWDDVREILDVNQGFDVLPGHQNIQTFYAAANACKLDVLETMFQRKFTFAKDNEDDAQTHLLQRICAKPADESVPVLSFLIARDCIDPTNALYKIASSNDVAAMQNMKAAGCDILTEHGSFFLAFFAGQKDMMHYLYDEGACLYQGSVLQGIYHRQTEVHKGGLEALSELLDKDAEKYEKIYTNNAALIGDLESFRRPIDGHGTLMHVAAKAGYFCHIAEAALDQKPVNLLVDDLLRPDEKGITVLAIMAARSDLKSLFDAKLWQTRPDDLLHLVGSLHAMRAENAVDIPALISDIKALRLRQSAQNGRFRLQP